MKRRILFLLVLICLMLGAFVSCTKDETPGAVGDGSTDITGNYIFKKNSEIKLVVSADQYESENKDAYNELAFDIDTALRENDAQLNVKNGVDTSDKNKREIILGRCDRELSRQAYRELDALKLTGSDTGFVIYSNGYSVAIAYNEDDTYITPGDAVEYFIENYIEGKSTLALEAGIAYSKVYSLAPYYQERDDDLVEKQWAELHSNITREMSITMSTENAKKHADDIIDSLKLLYTMYSDNLISWLANLLEPSICVCEGECKNTKYCGGAGFYYSNSGRNTIGFLPDSETTAQALGILKNSGMLGLVGDDVKAAFTEEHVAGFIRFCKGIQDEETGYFYHPQWNKEELGIARVSRDMSYACSVLSQFGSAPTYDAPNGVEGDGITYDGIDLNDVVSPVSSLTARLMSTSAKRVSSIVMSTAGAAYPAYMENENTYRSYLNTLDIKGNSYSVGNQIAASAGQLINRQKQLDEQGLEYDLISITDIWFRSNQNQKTGTWDFKEPGDTGYDPYYGNDGVLKISAWYNDVDRAFPNPALAAQNAIDAILCDQDIEHVCNLYNTWFTISNLKLNVTKHGDKAVATKFVNDLRLVAAKGIHKSYEKISDHRKEDGSFSYFQDHSSQTSQGMPVAVADTNEGDVNATSIATYGLVGYIFSALDFGDHRNHPDIYTDSDRRTFLSIVSQLGPVIKNDEIDPSVPNTFDYYTAGDPVSREEFGIANNNPMGNDNPFGTHFTVIKDEREGAFGNVLQYHSQGKVDSADYISLMSTTGAGGNTWAYSLDLNLREFIEYECAPVDKNTGLPIWTDHRTATKGDAIYINMGQGLYDDNIYMIVLRVREVDGEQVIGIWDSSSDSSGAAVRNHIADVPMGEWFNLKVEYYRMNTETTESMRAKIYINNKVVYVSDNYFDRQGDKITGVSSPANVFNRVWVTTVDRNTTDLLIDNFAVYKFRKNYTVEDLPIEQNVDGKGNDKRLYEFDSSETMPSEIELNGNWAIADEKLELSSGSLFVPANIRTLRYNRASFEADIKISGKNGTVGHILFVDNTYERAPIMMLGFKIVESAGKKYVQFFEMQDGVAGSNITGARFQLTNSVKLRVDFFDKEDKTLIYIDGKLVNQTETKFGEVNKLTYGGAQLVVNDGYTVTIDNLVADFDTCQVLDAPGVQLDLPENVEDFETDAGEAELIGSASVDNGAVKLQGKDAVIRLDALKRSNIGQCSLVSASIALYDETRDGDLVRLEMKDETGKVIFAVEIAADSEYIYAYEYAAGQRYPLVLAKSKKTETFNIRIEYYSEMDKANVYLNDQGVATTNISYNANSPTLKFHHAELTSLSMHTVLVDKMGAEIIYKNFAEVGMDGAINEENGKQTVTFDYALDKNMPNAVTGVFKTYGAGISIRQMLKRLDGKETYSKVGKLNVSAGGNDELKFLSSSDKTTLQNSSSIVFEGEFCVDTAYRGTLWQIIFGDSKKGLTEDASYMICLSTNASGEVQLYEGSSTTGANSRSGESKSVANVGEWFKMRIEYYAGDSDSVRIKVFINDVLLLVSDNYYRDYNKRGDVHNYFNQVNFYGYSTSYGTLYFDNISFYANDGAKCNDRVTETYEYGGAANPEFMR